MPIKSDALEQEIDGEILQDRQLHKLYLWQIHETICEKYSMCVKALAIIIAITVSLDQCFFFTRH